jgi:hypothetical protein
MEECAPIPSLVLAEFRWVDEESVSGCEKEASLHRLRRETVSLEIRDDEGGIRVLRTQVLTELIAEM